MRGIGVVVLLELEIEEKLRVILSLNNLVNGVIMDLRV